MQPMVDIDKVLKKERAKQNASWMRAVTAFENAKEIEPEIAALVATLIPGQNIKFQWGPASQTDGETVFVLPPIAFADLPEHGNIRDCQIIDPETLKHVCRACELRDDLLFLVLHECAHIVHDSFSEKGWPKPTSKLKKAPKDPHLFVTMNALEDARVNARTMDARPGTQRLFEMFIKGYIVDGITTSQGEHKTYNDLDDDMQALIGLFIISSHFKLNWDKFARPRVVEVLSRRDVQEIALAVIDFADVGEIKKAAKKLLRILRSQGFLLIDEKPEPKNPDPGRGEPGEGEPGEGEPGEGEPGEGEPGEGEPGEGEPGEGEPGEGEPGEGEPGEGEPGEGEPGEPKKTPLERARELEELFDRFGGHGEPEDSDLDKDQMEEIINLSDAMDIPSQHAKFQKITFADFDVIHENGWMERWNTTSRYGPQVDVKTAKNYGTSLALKARHIFAANQKVAWSKADRSGHVRRSTGRRLVSQNRNALFRRQRNDKRSYSVIIMSDLTGSTSNPMRDGKTRADAILTAGYACGEMLENLHIDWGFYGFGEMEGAFKKKTKKYDPYNWFTTVVEFKSFDEKWQSVKDRTQKAHYLGNNMDGNTLEWARIQMEKRPETDRIILYFTDGAVPAYGDQRDLFQKNVAICKQNPHLHILAVPVCVDSTIEGWGVDTEPINGVNDIMNVVDRLGRIIAR